MCVIVEVYIECCAIVHSTYPTIARFVIILHSLSLSPHSLPTLPCSPLLSPPSHLIFPLLSFPVSYYAYIGHMGVL